MVMDTEGMISLLQDNLRDRYRDCFSIIQELLQNADDAGNAKSKSQHVHFGISKGIDVDCPLLNGPALFVVNDGPVSPSDLDAIFRVAAGNKRADENKIGKFGLGMKSVFHVCEGFFMFGAGLECQNDIPCFCTPWSEDYHKTWWDTWESESELAAKKVAEVVRPVVSDWDRWFCVWIPMRREGQLEGISPIQKKFPDEQTLIELTGVSYSERASRMLPLLKNITSLSFGGLHGEARRYVMEASGRLHLDSGELSGSLTAYGPGATGYRFCGKAVLYKGDETFTQLQSLKYWPESTHKERLRESEKAERIEDKTKPHAAVCILIEDTDDARVSVSPCVFLPLSGPQERREEYSIPIQGHTGLTIYLHGNMFVDAGRQDMKVGQIPVPCPPDEPTLRLEWNRRLWVHAILPLFVPQLFAALKTLPLPTVSAVVEALSLIKYCRDWIPQACKDNVIANVLSVNGYEWQLLPSSDAFFNIPPIYNPVTRALAMDSLPDGVHLIESDRSILSGEADYGRQLTPALSKRFIETASERAATIVEEYQSREFLIGIAASVDFRELSASARNARLWPLLDRFLSYEELLGLASEYHLFVSGSNPQLKDRFSSAVEFDLYDVDYGLNRNLKLGVEPFSPTVVVSILQTRPKLKDAAHRTQLLAELLKADTVRDQAWRRACRYLVHGRKELFENDDPIFLPIEGRYSSFSAQIIRILSEQKLGVKCAVESKIVACLSQEDCHAIGLCSSTAAELVRMLGDVADRVSFDEFPDDSWKKLVMLASLDEEGVREALQKIPLFPVITGKLVALNNSCFWEREFKVHPILRDRLNILEDLGTDTAAKRVGQLAQTWTVQWCVRQCQGLDRESAYVVLQDLLKANTLEKVHTCYDYLTKEKWVPLKTGDWVAPSEIVGLENIDGLIPGLYYLADVREASCAELLKERKLLPSVTTMLELVFDFLALDSRFSIGRLSKISENVQALTGEKLRVVLRSKSVLPVLEVLEALDGLGLDYNRYLKKLCQPISPERLVAVINNITDRIPASNQKQVLWDFLLDYLEEASGLENFVDDVLPKIRFVSALNVVREPRRLCTEGVSIPQEFILNRRYLSSEKLMSVLVAHAGRLRKRDANERDVSFEEYFAEWDASLERHIGTFIICCSDCDRDIRLAKERYGYDHLNIEDARNAIGQGFEYVLPGQKLRITAISSDSINAVAIDGSDLPVELSGLETADDLFYGQFNPHERERIMSVNGRNQTITTTLKLKLRMPSRNVLENIGTTRLSVLLRKTLEGVLGEYRFASMEGLAKCWDSLSNGAQLDIAPTKAMILENAVGYLPSIGCKPPELKELFNRWHNLFVAEAQAADNNDEARVLKHIRDKNLIRKELERIILASGDLQRSILESVRKKIRKDYCYSERSILFELFQNADDASEELRQLYDDPKPDFVDKFVVRYDGSRLIIAHWGRMINQERARAGVGQRFDGFKRDLQKMLLLAQSDKDRDEMDVCGKFGLGFKTIYFISDNPIVLSGNLRFKIIGGYLPEVLTADEDRAYNGIRKMIEGDDHRFAPTIFILPVVDEKREFVSKIVDEFKADIEILSIFARRIKRIEVTNDSGEFNVTSGDGYALTDDLPVRICGDDHSFASIQLPRGELLLGWRDGAFSALADKIPTMWAKAPTRVCACLGLALNANFDLDPGRGVLNDNSPDNETLIAKIAESLYDILTRLYDHSTENDRRLLFGSLYQVLTEKSRLENWRDDTAHSGAAALRRILWGRETGAYTRLVHEKCVVASGLKGRLDVLCKIGEIQWLISDDLVASELATLIPDDKFIPGTVASFQLYRVGQAFFPDDVRHIPQYRVRDLMDDLRSKVGCFDPTWCAGEGARIILSALSNADKDIIEVLQTFQFKTKAGECRRAAELLIPDEHEGLKAAFMPPEYVLSGEYCEQGIEFVKFCRGERRVKARVLAAHAATTTDIGQQIAVLKYLANGNPSDEFKTELRKARNEGWLADWADSEAAGKLTRREKDRVADALAVNEAEYVQSMFDAWGTPPTPDSPEPPTVVRVPISIRAVRDWWRIHAEEELKDYNLELYDKPVVEDLSFDLDSPNARKAWMQVLVLGAAHALGMKNCQHKGFISHLVKRGYWDVYCKRDLQASEWLDTIDDFLDREELNGGKYNYWMRLFFRIYQFSKNLDVYVQLFKSWNWAKECAAPDLAAIKTNAALSGSDIDAPGLQKALPLTGLHFVYREMVRRHAIRNPLIYPQCYVPYEKVSEVAWNVRVSAEIYRKIVAEIGEQDATFGGAFDIALTQYDKHGREE